jgi:hypothetical protein
VKRDMNVIRDILVAIEEDRTVGGPNRIELPGVSREVMAYHIGLLAAAGYVDAGGATTGAGPSYMVRGLTMSGHDLAAALQDQEVWRETKAKLGDRFGRVTLEVVAGVALAILKERIRTYTGLDL